MIWPMWKSQPKYLPLGLARAANRDRLNPGNRDNGLGFRVGRTLTP